MEHKDEEYSSSDYSINNISYKSIKRKINKNNKSLEISKKLFSKTESKRSLNIINN